MRCSCNVWRVVLQRSLHLSGFLCCYIVQFCQAQVSDLDGANWIMANYQFRANGSLQQFRLVGSCRGVTNLAFSLRDNQLRNQLLNLNGPNENRVNALVEEYDIASKDPKQEFIFDYRTQDYEVYVIQSKRWQKSWRSKLENTLEPDVLKQVDQATFRWMLGAIGFEGYTRLHFGHESFLGLSASQQREVANILKGWRIRMQSRNEECLQDHLMKVSAILSADQKAVYERDYAAYFSQLQHPIEVLMFQLSLSESSDLVKEKLEEDLELPDAWLTLPTTFVVRINGELEADDTSGMPVGKQKLQLLQELNLSDVLDLTDEQMKELDLLRIGFEAEFKELESEFSMKVNEAAKLYGFKHGNPFPSSEEINVVRAIEKTTIEKQKDLDVTLARDIDQILVPKQLEFMEILAARSEVRMFGLLNCLRLGRLGKQLKVTARQREALLRIQEDERRAVRRQAETAEREFLADWTNILTVEQQKEWAETIGEDHEFYLPRPNLLLIEPSRF